jgi:DNA-binding IclR family transcriptional regulator
MVRTEHQPTLRVLDVLELLAATAEGLTLTEIAAGIGSSKSTLLPVVHTLARRNFILFDKKNYRYSIGIATYCAGAAYTAGKTAFHFIKTVMEDIVAKSGEICQMGVLVEGQILYVAKVDSNQPVRIASHIGTRLPAYCTALGKAILASKSMDEIRALYPGGLTSPLTPNTVREFSDLEKQLRGLKGSGVFYECGEVIEQTECFAIPLYKQNLIFAALSVSVPVFRASGEKKKLIIALLKEARTKIESYLNINDIEIDSLLIRE